MVNFLTVAFFINYLAKKPEVKKEVDSILPTTAVLQEPSPTKKPIKISDKSEVTKVPVKKPNTPTPAEVTTEFSFDSELGKHNNSSDCWLKIDGNFYNITSYFGKHPGGDVYLTKYCGKDATAGFNTKDGVPAKIHSAAAKLILSGYKIN